MGAKKRYQRPVLRRHGGVEQVTLTRLGSGTRPGPGMMDMAMDMGMMGMM
jgi:hypothetical protein